MIMDIEKLMYDLMEFSENEVGFIGDWKERVDVEQFYGLEEFAPIESNFPLIEKSKRKKLKQLEKIKSKLIFPEEHSFEFTDGPNKGNLIKQKSLLNWIQIEEFIFNLHLPRYIHIKGARREVNLNAWEKAIKNLDGIRNLPILKKFNESDIPLAIFQMGFFKQIAMRAFLAEYFIGIMSQMIHRNGIPITDEKALTLIQYAKEDSLFIYKELASPRYNKYLENYDNSKFKQDAVFSIKPVENLCDEIHETNTKLLIERDEIKSFLMEKTGTTSKEWNRIQKQLSRGGSPGCLFPIISILLLFIVLMVG